MIPQGNYFKDLHFNSRNEYTLFLSSQSRWFFFQMTLTFINTCNYMYVNIFFKTIVHETTDQAFKDKESATSALKGLGVRQLATKVDNLAQSLIKDKKLKNSLWRLFLIELEEDARVLTERKLSYLSNTTYEGLAQFDWFYVVEEMLRYQPLLTDVIGCVNQSKEYSE